MRFLRSKHDPGAADPGYEPAADPAPTLDGPPSEEVTSPSRTPGKGRPTPSRREAEARKRGPALPPPKNQREALRRMRGNKAERRQESARRRERMLAGDEKYLLPRDRGPVKAYVRDVVDSRRNVAGLFMPLALLVVLVILVPSPAVQQYVSLLSMAMLMMMLAEGVLLGRIVNRGVRARFPDAKASPLGLGFYALTRATQLRRLRVPKPRVGYGDAIPGR